jgi:transcriptional regulator with XRE-family HTH domain
VTTADEDRIAARQAEAIRLRVRGKTIREIAQATGVSIGQAHTDVRAAMAATAKEAEENVQQERGLQLARLERALRVIEDVLLETEDESVSEGEDLAEHDERIQSSRELKLKALDRLVKLEDQRAKLLGLYAPEKRDINAKVAAVGLDDLDELRRGAEANAADAPCSPSSTETPSESDDPAPSS